MTHFHQSPTLQQIVRVYNVVRFGRGIVSRGLSFTPDEAVEFRELMNHLISDFQLPFANDDDTPEQSAVRREIEETAHV